MLTRLKSLAGQSAIYGLGKLLPNAIGFFLIPLYTRFLTPADYAILSVATTISSMLTIFYEFGLRGAVTRFYFDFLDDEIERRAYFGTIWIFITLASLLLTLLLDWQGDELFGLLFRQVPFRPYGRLALWLAFTGVAAVIPLVLFRVREQAFFYVLSTISRFLFSTLAIIFFVAKLKQGAAGSLKGQLLTSAVFAVLFTIISLRNLRPALQWEKLKASLAFGLPMIPHQLSNWALNVSDRLLLERFVSLDQLGLYSLGYRFGNMLGIVLGSINSAWAPFFYRVAATEKDAPQTFARLTTYYVIFVLILGLGLALGAKEIVVLMAQPAFHEAYRVVPVVTLAFLFRGLYFITVNALFFTKQTKKLPLFTLLSAITNIGLNLLTLPRFGIMAAAWNTVAGYAVSALLVYRETRRVYPIPYEYRRLGMLPFAAGAIFLAGHFVELGNPSWNLMVKILVVGCFPVLLFVFRFFTSRELAGMRRGMERLQQRVVNIKNTKPTKPGA